MALQDRHRALESSNMERGRVAERFSREDYTVGWICALATELVAAAAMLDETYAPPAAFRQDPNDSNVYSYGRIGQHKIVVASLGAGMPGKVPANTTATNLLRSFPKIRFGLMVGIGGGIPARIVEDSTDDIRLGDVVVSTPNGQYGGVVQYDHGKIVHEGQFVQTGSLGKPPAILLKAVQRLQAEHDMQDSSIPELLGKILQGRPKMAVKYRRPEAEDHLYQAEYEHPADAKNCSRCDARHLVQRPARESDEPVIHYGLIGSADRVMLHGPTRDKLRTEKNIICLEMEAAGLMDSFPCLVIRGISDYADSHKSDRWHGYASIVAAGYAKELLNLVPELTREPTAVELMSDMSRTLDQLPAQMMKIGQVFQPLASPPQQAGIANRRDGLSSRVPGSRSGAQRHGALYSAPAGQAKRKRV